MTYTVTFSEFRKQLKKYIDLINTGNTVEITDGRNGKKLTTLKATDDKDDFDWDEHIEWMKNFKPFWTDEDEKLRLESRKIGRERRKRLNW